MVIRSLAKEYIINNKTTKTTQEILDSGIIPKLKGYIVKPGKVSDSIFGGEGSFIKDGHKIQFCNPPLLSKKGIPIRIMVRTQRISTHDIVRGEIPFKDQVLALNHNFMRKLVRNVIGTSQIDVGLDNQSIVIVAENLKTIPFENVLRAYMAKTSTKTSLYQNYINGTRTFCGHKLPDGLVSNIKLPDILDTPSTKTENDKSVQASYLIEKGIFSNEQYNEIKLRSKIAFDMVSLFLEKRNIILVDTKLEHGINSKGEIVSQDELFTMDSSRYWIKDDYDKQKKLFEKGEIKEINPKSYSKEFARGLSIKDKKYTDKQRIEIAVRYVEGIEKLLGIKFMPDMRSWEERVIFGINKVLKELEVLSK